MSAPPPDGDAPGAGTWLAAWEPDRAWAASGTLALFFTLTRP